MKNTVSLLAILAATAFDPGKAGWKMDAEGKIEVKDGNPVWIDGDGSEKTLGADTIVRLNGDAKQLRIAKEAAERKLEAYKDIKDPAAALAAVQKLSEIDQSKLIDSGKLDEVKASITSQFQAQIAEKDKAFNELSSKFDNSQINNLFASSEFIRDRIAVPRDMFEATFKQNVKLKDGQFEFYGRDGNRLMSKTKIGEYADASEALELLVDSHPQKDIILKADVGGGGSGGGGNGGARGAGRTIKRSEWAQLPANQQAEWAKKMGAGEANIVD